MGRVPARPSHPTTDAGGRAARPGALTSAVAGGGSLVTEEPKPNERTEALIAGALATYGERLDDAQREVLRQHVERLRQSVALLDGYALQNADEPDFAFQAIDR